MQSRCRDHARNRGAAAILAMMFLVIFGSLAAAMAIVSQGNLHTAQTHIRINRSLAAAETGMQYVAYRMHERARTIYTRDGVVDGSNAPVFWESVATAIVTDMDGEFHNLAEPIFAEGVLVIGPVAIGPPNDAGVYSPTFTATFTPHPLAGENYNDPRYQQPPFSDLPTPISSANPLDSSYIRVVVVGRDGVGDEMVERAISMDFRIDKKIRFALLSKNRVMVGRNVMIEGPVGSRFTETNLTNGHPIQVQSDFRGLNPDLDNLIEAFVGSLIASDVDFDNRLNIYNPTEVENFDTPQDWDINGDGYIDDFDLFLSVFGGTSNPSEVTPLEIETHATNLTNAQQLFELIDTMGDPSREGYNDGVLDARDRYVKIRGEVYIKADRASWDTGAAYSETGDYRDHLEGPIKPDFGESAMNFESSETGLYEFEPSDFDVTTFRNKATGSLAAQAASPEKVDSSLPATITPAGPDTREAVPFGAAHPYDYYERTVYENMRFYNVTIPKGSNALFKNCHFVGVTFVESETDNTDINYNYAGMQEYDGLAKHADRSALVNGSPVTDTKTVSNNIRFDSCIFEGSIVTDAPNEYTHVRNKIAFTGGTRFLDVTDQSESVYVDDSDRDLLRRSSILAPHYSIEMGTFISPHDNSETVKLSGTIVAGIIDMRGQVKVRGTIVTTFEPKSDTGPVIGATSPQFNSTLGYFSSEDGDLEAELPANGIGVIQVVYDPSLPLPDGINGPIEFRPLTGSYRETDK